MSYEAETGPNVTVMGTPVANRAVTFSSADDRQRIVLSVDQYGSADDARRAFDEAALASNQVPGVVVDSITGLGEKALIGVGTQGNETHVGGGALFGDLIVIATLQFFEGSDENKKRVTTLIREEAELAAEMGAQALRQFFPVVRAGESQRDPQPDLALADRHIRDRLGVPKCLSEIRIRV